MKFAFMQNLLTQIPFFARIYNSFIISHLLEWLKVRQIKSGIRINFDQCEISTNYLTGSKYIGQIIGGDLAFLEYMNFTTTFGANNPPYILN